MPPNTRTKASEKFMRRTIEHNTASKRVETSFPFENTMSYPLTDDFAAIAPRFSAAISTFSSAFIIFAIFCTRTKLSTIYHRIMIGMSLCDILGSVAMGLTTLAMPKEVTPGMTDYMWTGTRLGNAHTCRAQGFFATFGATCMFSYNGTLCMYYL